MKQKNIFQGALTIMGYCFLSLFIYKPQASYALESFTVAKNTFIFNPKTLSYKAINAHGKVIKSGRASGGKRGRRTPVGTYYVQRKHGAGCYSRRYRAKMPYCSFFKPLYAVHGYKHVPNYNASRGCIRLRISDAKWLHQNFFRIGTKVIVKPY